MNKTPIEWTDYTWNPITGCLRGCEYCYARKISHRFKRSFEPTLHEDRLEEPAKLKKPSKIFVCSMGDLFGAGVDRWWRQQVFFAMDAAPQHTYQILTKCPDGYSTVVVGKRGNVWLGATATDQASWDLACEHLSQLPDSVVRWISAEPMLSYIHPRGWLPDWVVIGALTGHGFDRLAKSGHAGRCLSGRLRAARVPVFEKDSLGGGERWRRWPR